MTTCVLVALGLCASCAARDAQSGVARGVLAGEGIAPRSVSSTSAAQPSAPSAPSEELAFATTSLVGTYWLAPLDLSPNPSPFAHTEQLWDPPSPITAEYVNKVADRFADVIADTQQLVAAGMIDGQRAHDRLRAVLTDGTPPDTLGQRPSITAILGASASCISFATAAGHWALVRYDYVADLERDAHNLNGTPWLLRVRAGEADPCLGR